MLTLGSIDARVLKETYFWLMQLRLCSLQPLIPLGFLPSPPWVHHPSEDESAAGLREHPCNHICLNGGQILVVAVTRALLHYPVRGRLSSFYTCSKQNSQTWNKPEEDGELVYKVNICFHFSNYILTELLLLQVNHQLLHYTTGLANFSYLPSSFQISITRPTQVD